MSATLPDKPSDLLELALHDLEVVEHDPRYMVDMNTWHVPRGGVCHVCLAGAVMSNTLELPPTDDFSPILAAERFGNERFSVRNKLRALDAMRAGSDSVGYALEYWLNYDTSDFPGLENALHDLPTPPTYEEDKTGFKKAMHKIVSTLQKFGL